MRSPAGVSVSGTLAADALDLAAADRAAADAVRRVGRSGRTSRRLPKPSPEASISISGFRRRAPIWGGHEIDNAAAAVSQRGGRFSVKLLESGFAHGSLTGDFWIEDKQGVCESRLALALENADFGALAAEFGVRDFAGEGALKASVSARGRSPAEIVATADGEGSLEIGDGVLREAEFRGGVAARAAPADRRRRAT